MTPQHAVAVIFTSTRTRIDDEGYAQAAWELEALAREVDGFLMMHSVRDPETGDGITVSYWRDEDAALAWKQNATHREAQQLGRERWYSRYEVHVATVTRTYAFTRTDDEGTGTDD